MKTAMEKRVAAHVAITMGKHLPFSEEELAAAKEYLEALEALVCRLALVSLLDRGALDELRNDARRVLDL